MISVEILDFVEHLDVKEVHGYEPNLGFQVFTPGSPGRARGPIRSS